MQLTMHPETTAEQFPNLCVLSTDEQGLPVAHPLVPPALDENGASHITSVAFAGVQDGQTVYVTKRNHLDICMYGQVLIIIVPSTVTQSYTMVRQ
jgi:hypothetical protein